MLNIDGRYDNLIQLLYPNEYYHGTLHNFINMQSRFWENLLTSHLILSKTSIPNNLAFLKGLLKPSI
jgi:hypothetical protein